MGISIRLTDVLIKHTLEILNIIVFPYLYIVCAGCFSRDGIYYTFIMIGQEKFYMQLFSF